MRPKYRFGEFQLDPASRELLRNGHPVPLRPKSLECIVYLIEHRDRAVGRDELISAVWGRVDVSDTVVAQTLLRARKALDDTGNQQGMIRTVPRFGYRWVVPVEDQSIPSEAAQGEESAADPWEEVEIEAPVSEPGPGDGSEEAAAAEETDAGGAAAVAPPSGPPRRILNPAWAIFVAVLVVLGLGFHLLGGDGASPPMGDDAVLVMPVAFAPMDSENAWVRLGAMDYMAARLRSGGLDVLPSEQALRLSAAVDGDALSAVVRQELLALSGARWIAMPEMQRGREGWSIRLRLFDEREEQRIEAQGDTALAAAAQAADAWLRKQGRGKGGPTPGPLAERLHRIDAEILAGRLAEARRLVNSASPAERNDPRFLSSEAKLAFRAGDLDAAGKLFQRALARADGADLETRIGALIGLGTVERSRNNLDAADQRFTQSLALLESLPADRVNSRMVGVTYQGRGIIRAQRGDLDAGIRDMGQARVWIQRSEDRITLGVVGHNLGKAEALRGDYLQALREFDRAIEIFERFRVDDYLANTLQEKARVQLALARPDDAWATIRRADPLLPKLEDDAVAVDVMLARARVQVAQGRLRDAGDTLAGLRARDMQDSDPRLLELRLRLHLARGETSEARRLAGNGPPTGGVSGGLLLAAVQAALLDRDVPLAKAWLGGEAPAEEPRGDHAISLELARALIARAAGDRAAALQLAGKAAALAGNLAAPEIDIRSGVIEAMVLLDTHQYAAASAITGELEKYAESDYRVAWLMSALYQALGDPRAATAASERARALAGERNLTAEPIL